MSIADNEDAEEEEEEEEEEAQGNYDINSFNANLSGEKAEEIKGQEAIPGDDSQLKSDMKNAQTRDAIDELWNDLNKKTADIDDEIDPNSHEDYQLLYENTIEDMSIQCLYNKLYGPHKHEEQPDKYFWNVYLEENKNYDISISTDWEKEDAADIIPQFYRDDSKIIEDYSIEELKEDFSDMKNVKMECTYVHPLNHSIGPSKCDIVETHNTYFVSPMKFIVRGFVDNKGFMYCDCFNPMSICIVEQKYDKKKNKFSVHMKYYFRVNFVKSVRFFQNKIRTEAINETTKTYKESFDPVTEKYLEKFQPQFKRPIPVLKKKLTKSAKLMMKMEDMETEHEEQVATLKKSYEQQISKLSQELESVKEVNSQLSTRLYMAIGLFLLLLFIFKAFS